MDGRWEKSTDNAIDNFLRRSNLLGDSISVSFINFLSFFNILEINAGLVVGFLIIITASIELVVINSWNKFQDVVNYNLSFKQHTIFKRFFSFSGSSGISIPVIPLDLSLSNIIARVWSSSWLKQSLLELGLFLINSVPKIKLLGSRTRCSQRSPTLTACSTLTFGKLIL